jgi:hypothetical protein
MEAVAVLDEPGHHLVWAVSDNTRGWFSLEAGKAIGFLPLDNAENHIAPDTDVRDDPDAVLAGAFIDAEHPLGGTW